MHFVDMLNMTPTMAQKKKGNNVAFNGIFTILSLC